MSDVSKTNELIVAKLRKAAKQAEWYQALDPKLLTAAADALEAATRERDAALAAIERVRAILSVKWRDGGVPSRWHSQLTAALDGAPEPEWEYGLASRTARIPNVIGISDNMPLRDEFGRVTVRRRKAGPWEPVEGESSHE